MIRSACSQLQTQLQEIKELKTEFDLELPKIQDTRDTAPALGLEKEIKEGLAEIRASLQGLFLERQIREAENILGQDMLGPGAIEVAFGVKLENKDIPPIPFSKVELERAKELGQFLILRVGQKPDGYPLTMKNMYSLKGGKKKDGKKILSDSDLPSYTLSHMHWWPDQNFFTTDTPSLGWALVSKDVIPASTHKNYLDQTEKIVNYLETKVFKGQSMPLEYQEAINEFMLTYQEIESLMDSDRTLALERLGQLKINQLFRHTPVEILYDYLLMQENSGRNILGHYAWINQVYRNWIVNVGYDDGFHIGENLPDYFNDKLGVIFCRKG